MSEGVPNRRRIRPGRRGRAARRSFTLVELLVVMGIFALLMTMALPLVLNRSPGIAAAGAVSRLKATVNLARQWAITRRVTTYVVFPSMTNTFTAAADRPFVTTVLRGFNIWTAEDGYLNEWQFLPPGFVFDPNPLASSGYQTETVFHAIGADRFFDVRMPLNSSVTQRVSCLSFRPDGRLNQAGGTTLQAVFIEGSIDANTATGVATNLLKKAGTRAYGVKVQPLTGRPRVVEY